MKLNLSIKIALTLFLLIFAITSIALYFVYENTVNVKVQEVRSSLLMIARLTAVLIDGDQHKAIPLSKSGMKTPEYELIREKLRRVQKENPLIKYIYTVAQDSKRDLVFAVDAASEEELFSYPGERYDATQLGKEFEDFVDAQVKKELITAGWETFVSGYAPVFDSEGNQVALVGVDILSNVLAQARDVTRKTFFYIFFLNIFLSLLLGSLLSLKITRPIKKLLEGTRVIASGNLDYHVDIKRKDEIGELSDSFNEMAASLANSYKNLKISFINAIRSLTIALEAKDAYTKGHSERVAKCGKLIAEEMKLSDEECETLENLAIMHDIGKIGIQENILNKPAELTEKERDIIEQHPAIGEDILKPITFLDPNLLSLIRSHHERPDGSGYPDGLQGDEIPLLVSILTVADAYDAMVTNRPYREALSREEAIKELFKYAHSQYSLPVIEALQRIIEKGALDG
ncbi:HD domain-containing phosphohydrolase [Candidatus Omnitrophota bacterium]